MIMIMKKGEISTSFSVMAIILVISFVIILGFWYLIFSNYDSRLDKDSCRMSVISRATFNYKEIAIDKIPLKCKTEKICITSKKDYKCIEELGVSTKKNPITFVELPSNDDAAKIKLLETFADAMYDCHWMLGEGKVNFMPSEVSSKNYCIICSRIAFDAEDQRVSALFDELTAMDMLNYLDFKEDIEGNTYFNSIYGGKNFDDIVDSFNEKMKDQYHLKKSNKIPNDLSLTNSKIGIGKEYIIVAGLKKEGDWSKIGIFGGAALLVGAVIAWPFVAGGVAVIATLAAATGGATSLSLGFVYKGADYEYMTPMIIPYSSDSLSELGCDYFENIP
jgi:hypothetical protein